MHIDVYLPSHLIKSLNSLEIMLMHSEYLFDKRMDTGKSKFDEILQRVKEYGEEVGVDGGGYSLYISGHR